MKALLSVFVTLALAACASAPKEPETPAPAPSTAGTEAQDERVDMDALVNAMGLEAPAQELGYKEKSFDTCSAGYGFSSSHNCRRLTLSVIHVRLQCRDSEGTISTALGASDLVSIANQGVHWTLQHQDGTAMTDGEGYATVRGLFRKSPKNDWLRLAVGIQFLNTRANQITRVVTPRPWCHPDASVR